MAAGIGAFLDRALDAAVSAAGSVRRSSSAGRPEPAPNGRKPEMRDSLPTRYTGMKEVPTLAASREQLHRALDTLPEASLPALAEYMDWLARREEAPSPDELAEVRAADDRVRRGEVPFGALRPRGRGHGT